MRQESPFTADDDEDEAAGERREPDNPMEPIMELLAGLEEMMRAMAGTLEMMGKVLVAMQSAKPPVVNVEAPDMNWPEPEPFRGLRFLRDQSGMLTGCTPLNANTTRT